MAQLSEEHKNELIELLDEVRSRAWEVTGARVMDVDRDYRKLCDKVEQYDERAKEIGMEFTRELPVDLSELEEEPEDEYEFFWKNELWYSSSIEEDVSPETTKTLNILYSLPFAYEVTDAYDTDEKVRRAQFVVEQVNITKEQIEQL